ncbi:hypothetical protein V501_09269, partial [Pseudogymnoascus sp. VKM F-4519 (FW-2642)]
MASKCFQRETSWVDEAFYNNYPTQLQTWDDEALRQVPKRLRHLRPKPPQLEMEILEPLSPDSNFTGGGKSAGGDQQSQMQTQKVAQSTHVDALMSAIQAKPAGDSGRRGGGASTNAGEDPMKSHKCYIGECRKAFPQKAHLEVHIRTHTGAKPYTCPTCTHDFSQLSNLKNHLRGHTGERPFACPTCDKTFAVRSNVRAHAAVHDAGSAAKKYVCLLDGCGKCFTLLGNLKSHMNKFHVETLGALTARIAESEARGGGKEGEEDELLEYFRGLYRNANKGIRGRRKGRKIASTTHNTDSTATSPPSLSSSTYSLSSLASLPLSPTSSTSISYTGGVPAHFNMGMGAGIEMEMFEGSRSGIGSLCASSLGS